jgi:hypothetical protein
MKQFRLLGRYDNLIPSRFLVPIDCLKIERERAREYDLKYLPPPPPPKYRISSEKPIQRPRVLIQKSF